MTRSGRTGIEPKITVGRVTGVSDADDALGLAEGLVRDGLPGSLLDPIKAAFVRAHVRIVRRGE
jgi:hypothetical protein